MSDDTRHLTIGLPIEKQINESPERLIHWKWFVLVWLAQPYHEDVQPHSVDVDLVFIEHATSMGGR